jgi:hypothetical protein
MEFAEDLVCVNKDCPSGGRPIPENVLVRRTYGVDRIRFVRCRSCKLEFSERRGTAFFDLRMPEGRAVDVVRHLAEGIGVRKTSRSKRRRPAR